MEMKINVYICGSPVFGVFICFLAVDIFVFLIYFLCVYFSLFLGCFFTLLIYHAVQKPHFCTTH